MNRVELAIRQIDWHQPDCSDQCTTGRAELRIDGHVVVAEDSGEWNLTMAGLYLLRTLSADNTPDDSVCEGNFLFPCCGHSPWLIGTGKYRLQCLGCAYGVDCEIRHRDGLVHFHAADVFSAAVPEADWRAAVLGYVRAVEAFYAASPPRSEPDGEMDGPGWVAFWQEWKERAAAA